MRNIRINWGDLHQSRLHVSESHRWESRSTNESLPRCFLPFWFLRGGLQAYVADLGKHWSCPVGRPGKRWEIWALTLVSAWRHHGRQGSGSGLGGMVMGWVAGVHTAVVRLRGKRKRNRPPIEALLGNLGIPHPGQRERERERERPRRVTKAASDLGRLTAQDNYRQ
ncbi:hypothetical protein BX600DRAFT_226125 [Xylariales sp. PMI_506]|nr:hypothetical protein BX600DRAFT_226125 [Xylariales sp. PMI_506]